MLHLNIRSIANKFDSFKNLIDTLDVPFQIIGLTETWLNEANLDNFSLKNNEYIGSNRPKTRGCGVGMYVSKQLQYKNRIDLSRNHENIIETKFIEVTNNNGKNSVIGVIHRPPNSNSDTFENTMNTILEKVERENEICYLMGDFNIDLFIS